MSVIGTSSTSDITLTPSVVWAPATPSRSNTWRSTKNGSSRGAGDGRPPHPAGAAPPPAGAVLWGGGAPPPAAPPGRPPDFVHDRRVLPGVLVALLEPV